MTPLFNRRSYTLPSELYIHTPKFMYLLSLGLPSPLLIETATA